MDVGARKSELRKHIRKLQSRLQPQYIAASDMRITARVLELNEYRQAETLFIFVGTATEIDTAPLLQNALASGKRVAVPRCVGDGIMQAYVISGTEDLAAGAYGILEPRHTCPPIPAEEIDFGVIPCISCDRQGNRLGHGGGFYDRYLAGVKFPTAALCREPLLCDCIPSGNFDIAVDMVITEDKIYRRGTNLMQL